MVRNSPSKAQIFSSSTSTLPSFSPSSRREPFRFGSRLGAFISLTFGSCLICFTLTDDARAQTGNLGDAVAHPVPGAGHDYIHGLNETVNPANGSLNIKIDLPLPASRGLTMPFALTYNSGEVHQATPGPSAGGMMDSSTPSSRAQNGYGWSDTLPYVSASVILTAVYSEPSGGTSGYGAVGTCPVSTFYNFYEPSGESHMLGIAALGAVTITNHSEPPTTGCTQAPLSPELSQPYYVSMQSGGDDQVAATMEANCNGSPTNTVPDCAGAAPSFTVTDHNSTKYKFPANTFGVPGSFGSNPYFMFPNQIEDRNGNVINFNVIANTSTVTLPVTDTAGRSSITSNLTSPYSAGVTQYTVGGLNYNLAYTTTNANFTPSSVEIAPNAFTLSQITCVFNTKVSDSSRQVVQSISLPNGTSYSFQYDPTYGLVDRINYPDGGWVSYQWQLSPVPSTLATFSGYVNGDNVPTGGLCNWRYQTPVIVQRQVGYSQQSGAALSQSFTYSTTWASGTSPTWTSKSTTVTTTDWSARSSVPLDELV
jgi:hypothetical protein